MAQGPRTEMARLVGGIVIALALAIPAAADSISSYNIFAGHSIVGVGSVNAPGEVVGSNGDLFLSGVTAASVHSGGSIFDDFNAVTTTGDVTIDGNAQMTFFGSIGGNVNVGQSATLTANVAGNILAGGNVTTSGNTTGSIFAGGSISATGTVGGSTHPFTAVSPPSFTTVALPSAHTFSSGGTSFTLPTFATQTLAPGSYGELLMIGSNTINLSAGNYFFSDIRMTGSFVTFNFDTTHGPINIFVSGPVDLVSASMNLNGVASGSVSSAAAAQVYWETHDNFHTEFTNLLGTVYAPFGDIQLFKLSQVNGNVIAGNDIITDGGTFAPGAQSTSLLLPEPSGLTLGCLAMAGLVAARARIRRRVNARLP